MRFFSTQVQSKRGFILYCSQEDVHMDSMDNFRERFEALEQQTEQLKHETQALTAPTRTVERRLRWWQGGCFRPIAAAGKSRP